MRQPILPYRKEWVKKRGEKVRRLCIWGRIPLGKTETKDTAYLDEALVATDPRRHFSPSACTGQRLAVFTGIFRACDRADRRR